MPTVTRRTKSYDTSGNVTETVTTFTGGAIQKSNGEAEAYQRLGLTREEAPLLLFTPSSYSDTNLPRAGDEITWPDGGPTYVVQSARHLRPDGVADVICYLVIRR
jgi:hypothetical protein